MISVFLGIFRFWKKVFLGGIGDNGDVVGWLEMLVCCFEFCLGVVLLVLVSGIGFDGCGRVW